jgi:hypothetical protein
MHKFLVDKILNPHACYFGAPATSRGEGGQQQGAIAQIDQAIAGAGG